MSLNAINVKLFLKNIYSGTQCGGFQFLLILDLWGISFHAVVVFGLGKNFLFKSALEHCVIPCLVISDIFGVLVQKFGRFCHVIFWFPYRILDMLFLWK